MTRTFVEFNRVTYPESVREYFEALAKIGTVTVDSERELVRLVVGEFDGSRTSEQIKEAEHMVAFGPTVVAGSRKYAADMPVPSPDGFVVDLDAPAVLSDIVTAATGVAEVVDVTPEGVLVKWVEDSNAELRASVRDLECEVATIAYGISLVLVDPPSSLEAEAPAVPVSTPPDAHVDRRTALVREVMDKGGMPYLIGTTQPNPSCDPFEVLDSLGLPDDGWHVRAAYIVATGVFDDIIVNVGSEPSARVLVDAVTMPLRALVGPSLESTDIDVNYTVGAGKTVIRRAVEHNPRVSLNYELSFDDLCALDTLAVTRARVVSYTAMVMEGAATLLRYKD